jgi:DNA-binding response OmpR family regulator
VPGYSIGVNQTPHILLVEDHCEIRDLVQRVVQREGFRVSLAAEGRAMRKSLAEERIDLILLDLMLPGEDGLSLCRAVRADSRVPIIMLTAKGEEVDRVIGLEMGADDYLAKPFGSRELIARIGSCGWLERPTVISTFAKLITSAKSERNKTFQRIRPRKTPVRKHLLLR